MLNGRTEVRFIERLAAHRTPV